MSDMDRRLFIETLAAASLIRPAVGQNAPAQVSIDTRRPRNPVDALLRDIAPGHDEFPFEKQAGEIANALRDMMKTRVPPLSANFRGVSPHPASYRPLAEGVAAAEFDPADTAFTDGLNQWIESLGEVHAARFFVLPEGFVRYEIASANGYRVGRWKQQWEDGKLSAFSPVEETVTSAARPLFADITARVFAGVESFDRQLAHGVPWWRARLDAASGIDLHAHNGIAAGDIDGDGIDEIYICQPGGLPNRLYKVGAEGVFEDITEHAGVGVLDNTSSALFADFRNSGRQDLVVLRPNGPLYFVNEGNNRFTVKPGAFRFRTAPEGSFTGMAAADYDRDGRVDLYLCTYSFFRDGGQYRYPVPYHDAQNGPANFLFHNRLTEDGGGMFADVTAETGLSHNNNRFSFAPAWCDYNGDGWPDLYVANDFGRKNLYRNENGKFRDVAAEAGVEDIGDGMSAAWFDYDGDGRPDLYVGNMWSDAGQRVVDQQATQPAPGWPADAWRRHAKGNSLYRNRGDGTFEETGAAEGVEMGRWAWSSDGVDFDCDGVPEILIATGMLTNSSETDLESFFWRKVAAASPMTAKSDPAYENGWNALSQAVHGTFSEAGRQPNVFYVRKGGRYYDFSGVSGVDFAEDSRAFAVTDIDGDGYPDLVLKNRLGPQVRVLENNSANGRRSLAIRLRGVQSNRDAIGARVTVDGKTKFVQAGCGYLSQHTKTLYFGMGEALGAKSVRIEWPGGATQEFSNLASGALHEIEEGAEQVRTAAFAIRKNPPAPDRAIPTENAAPVFADTWLIEPVPLPEPAPAGYLQITDPALAGQAPAPRVEWYRLFIRYLFDLHAEVKFPVWLLVDNQSRAQLICFSNPARRFDASAAPLPFPGKYCTPPHRNYSSLGAAFHAAGFPEQALRYLELSPQSDPKILAAIGQIHLEAARWDQAKKYLEQCVTLQPDFAEAWNNLGNAAVGSGNLRKGLENYEKAISLQPAMVPALINAGQARAGLGDAAGAEKLYERALAADPNSSAAANQMGELYAARRQYAKAKTWYQRALEARRDYQPAIGNLAALYTLNNQPNDAIAALRYGISVSPDETSFYLNLASLYRKAGNADKARQTIRGLLARQPSNPAALQALRELER
jgi:tetratricopeptide (TPR) repeat protein